MMNSEVLRQNLILSELDNSQWNELLPLLTFQNFRKNQALTTRGDTDLFQLFIVSGIIKCCSTNDVGKEIILHFFADGGINTNYIAWRLRESALYTIRALTSGMVAKISMLNWNVFLNRHPLIKDMFDKEVMSLMERVAHHHAMLVLANAEDRLQNTLHEEENMIAYLTKSQLATYLGLRTETLHRVMKRMRQKAHSQSR